MAPRLGADSSDFENPFHRVTPSFIAILKPNYHGEFIVRQEEREIMFKPTQSKLIVIVSVVAFISLSLLSFIIYRTTSEGMEQRIEKGAPSVSLQASYDVEKPRVWEACRGCR